MSKRVVLGLVLLFVSAGAAGAAPVQSGSPDPQPPPGSAELEAMLCTPGWERALLSPAAESKEDLPKVFEYYGTLFLVADTLLKLVVREPDRWSKAYRDGLVRLLADAQFVALFLQDCDAVVSFARSEDAALRVLRVECGIPVPSGSAFFRFFRRPFAGVPEPLRVVLASADPKATAITTRGRFICVLVPSEVEEARDAQRDVMARKRHEQLRLESWQRTVSHEWVHAYLNSAVGFPDRELPTWFHEGTAIYCSNSNREVLTFIRTGEGLITEQVGPPEEYQAYARTFRFCEKRLGRSVLLANVGVCVKEASTSSLLLAMGYSSDDQLLEAARRDGESERRKRFLLILGGAVIAMILGVQCLAWLANRDINHHRRS